ncbi:DNA-binding response regulator, LytR/AlgR family [Spirosomataceae bacterium TFI 002]|nr:DNA-binding response regulator, LytR/AlgR family [Spirosomataceae bacterium TFI 002]
MKSLKILVLEDSVLTGRDLKNTLLKAGHLPPRVCRNVGEAIRTIDSEPFDIALIDIELEDKQSGIDFAHYINENHKIPFIFLTSHDDDNNFFLAKETNPAAYLIKPFKVRELDLQLRLAYENNLEDGGNELNFNPFIFLPVQGGIKKIDKNEVVYLNAIQSYTLIYLKGNKQPEKFSVNLGYLSQFFTEHKFVKISRSAVINLEFFEEVTDGFVILTGLPNKVKLKVSANSELLRTIKLIRRPK